MINDDELEALAKEIEDTIFRSGNSIKGYELRRILREELQQDVTKAQQQQPLAGTVPESAQSV